MVLRFTLLALLALTPLRASAQTPMNEQAFSAYVQGKTLYFGYDGDIYGAEEYLPNRRVRWSAMDGQCLDGNWYQDGELICFVYEDDPDPKCWSFYERGTGLMARFEDDPSLTTLFEVRQSRAPLVCYGPEVGV